MISDSLAFGQSRLNANLSGSTLSTLPDKWNGEDPRDFARISGHNLRNRFLLGINLRNSVLIKADFSGSDLGGADMSGADLRMMRYAVATDATEGWGLMLGAREIALGYRRREIVTFGEITNASFNNADLRFASLWPFSLRGSEFFRADLRYASVSAQLGPHSLIGADLRNATLMGNWNGTLFYGARLEGADLSGLKGVSPLGLAFVVVDSTTRLPNGIAPSEPISKPLSGFQAAMLKHATDACDAGGEGSQVLPGALDRRMRRCFEAAQEWMKMNMKATQ